MNQIWLKFSHFLQSYQEQVAHFFAQLASNASHQELQPLPIKQETVKKPHNS